jgi:Leucine-rich repeat (LRR) protein
MEKWKLCFIILFINFARAFDDKCFDVRGNLLEIKKNCPGDLKFDTVEKHPDEIKTVNAIEKRNFLKLNNGIFRKFENLETLSLKQCQNIEISSQAFQGLTKLKQLYLKNNQVMKLDQNVFEPLRNLETLDLENNKIENLDKNLLKHNGNIKVLTFDFNQISSLDDEFLLKLENLKEFSIQENQIKTVSSNVFKKNTKLTKLNLKNNKIIAIERDTFQHLSKLTQLNLEKNFCINKKFADSQSNTLDKDLKACYEFYDEFVKSKESITTTPCPQVTFPTCTCPTSRTSFTNECNNNSSVDDVDNITKLLYGIGGSISTLILILIIGRLIIRCKNKKSVDIEMHSPADQHNDEPNLIYADLDLVNPGRAPAPPKREDIIYAEVRRK